jgi:hypothetical protein
VGQLLAQTGDLLILLHLLKAILIKHPKAEAKKVH